ncbi:MAG: GNAT family N-acetyltransferase [Acidobacteria bacterium]|nr:GNAT family N-acetyltransferase [Acidobacteriota bacterium]NDC47923.1 N-acetyltransferase [Micrococcales bacterium]
MNNFFALTHQEVSLRVVRPRDAKTLERLVLSNREWLKPWEATNPYGPTSFDFKAQIKSLLRQLERNEGLPFVILYRNEIVGQLNVANIMHGSVSSCVIGYWIIPEVAGRGITPTAVALAMDYMFTNVGLHRVEIAIRPENLPSLRVVQKLGLRYEGLKKNYIHINNEWRDHYIFALTADEVPGGVLNRWTRGEVPEIFYDF